MKNFDKKILSSDSANATFQIYKHLEKISKENYKEGHFGIYVQLTGDGYINVSFFKDGVSILEKEHLTQVEGFEINYRGDWAEYHPKKRNLRWIKR